MFCAFIQCKTHFYLEQWISSQSGLLSIHSFHSEFGWIVKWLEHFFVANDIDTEEKKRVDL